MNNQPMADPQYSLRFDTKANVWVSYSYKEDRVTQGRTPEEAVTQIIELERISDKIRKESPGAIVNGKSNEA